MMTVFLQECAKRGVLFRRGGLVFITLSHTDRDIECTLKAVKEALQIIKKAYDNKELDKLLEHTGNIAEA